MENWYTLWQQSHPNGEVHGLTLLEKVARHSASYEYAHSSNNKHHEGKRKWLEKNRKINGGACVFVFWVCNKQIKKVREWKYTWTRPKEHLVGTFHTHPRCTCLHTHSWLPTRVKKGSMINGAAVSRQSINRWWYCDIFKSIKNVRKAPWFARTGQDTSSVNKSIQTLLWLTQTNPLIMQMSSASMCRGMSGATCVCKQS